MAKYPMTCKFCKSTIDPNTDGLALANQYGIISVRPDFELKEGESVCIDCKRFLLYTQQWVHVKNVS